jgi:hypothetical protein
MSVKVLLKHPNLKTLYWAGRSFPSWQRSLLPSRNSVADKQPWLTFSAINKIKSILNDQMRVFEYGSGGSTLFWSQRVKEVISIEHDRSWYLRLRSELDAQQITNVKYILAEAESDANFDLKRIDDPNDFVSGDRSFAGKHFGGYVKQIDSYPNEYFDIVVVDGRARPSCIAHSMKKVKKNGFLIIDNSERDYYLRNIRFNEKQWKQYLFAGAVPYIYHFSETRILKKINSAEK